MHLKLCAGPKVDAWLWTRPITIFLCLTLDAFSITLHIKFGFSHPLIFEVSHFIYSQPLDPTRVHLVHYIHVRARMVSHNIVWNTFPTIVKNARFHILWNQTHVFSPMPVIFIMLSCHCVISRWCLHFGKLCHCQLHSSLFNFVGYFLSWGCCDNYSSNEGWSLLQWILNGHVCPSSCKGFQMFTLTNRWIFLSMCQHEMRSERHLKPSTFNLVLIS